MILETEGYFTTVFNNAPEVDYINSLDLNLILLDIRLAGSRWDGNILCQLFKSKYPENKTPVMLVSAERDGESLAKACGADDFLYKPFDISDLLSRAQKLMV